MLIYIIVLYTYYPVLTNTKKDSDGWGWKPLTPLTPPTHNYVTAPKCSYFYCYNIM